MDSTNAELAHQILFTDPVTGEELFLDPDFDFKDEGEGFFSFEVFDKNGNLRWKHTIKTEEI